MSQKGQFGKDKQKCIKILGGRENIKKHLKRFNDKVIGINLDDKNDEQYYIEALGEIKSGKIKSGLMIKCEVASDGNQSKAQSLYIKTRVKQIIEEEKLKKEADDKLQKPLSNEKEHNLKDYVEDFPDVDPLVIFSKYAAMITLLVLIVIIFVELIEWMLGTTPL